MKLFKSLLVAPATLGLLAPFSAFAGEANLNDISKYSNLEHLDLSNAFVNDEPKYDSLLAGGEGLVDSDSFDGGFSETFAVQLSVEYQPPTLIEQIIDLSQGNDIYVLIVILVIFGLVGALLKIKNTPHIQDSEPGKSEFRIEEEE